MAPAYVPLVAERLNLGGLPTGFPKERRLRPRCQCAETAVPLSPSRDQLVSYRSLPILLPFDFEQEGRVLLNA